MVAVFHRRPLKDRYKVDGWRRCTTSTRAPPSSAGRKIRKSSTRCAGRRLEGGRLSQGRRPLERRPRRVFDLFPPQDRKKRESDCEPRTPSNGRFREARRRTRHMRGAFQDKTSMDRILFAVFTNKKITRRPLLFLADPNNLTLSKLDHFVVVISHTAMRHTDCAVRYFDPSFQ